jgi:hypothetical protein
MERQKTRFLHYVVNKLGRISKFHPDNGTIETDVKTQIRTLMEYTQVEW